MKLPSVTPFEDYVCYKIFSEQEERFAVCLVGKNNRTTISFAKYVMCCHLKRWISSKEEVDHIDNNPLNDDINNLQILTRLENERKKGIKRATVNLICYFCKKPFIKEQHQLHTTTKYCSRQCSYAGRRAGLH